MGINTFIMKQFAKEFGKVIAIQGLSTVKIVTIGTIGLASALAGTATNVIVAGCNTGMRKLEGKHTTFAHSLKRVHDHKNLANMIMDGRVTIVEAYDSVVPEDWKMVIDYLSSPYRSAAMDINNAKG